MCKKGTCSRAVAKVQILLVVDRFSILSYAVHNGDTNDAVEPGFVWTTLLWKFTLADPVDEH